MKVLWVQMIYLYLVFQFVEGRCHGNQLILGKCHERQLIPLAFFALSFKNELQCHCLDVCTNSGDDVAIFLWKFGERLLGNYQDNGAHLRTSGTKPPKNRPISLNISGHTGRFIAIFSPYESDLRADDVYVPYFPICQAMLPWQPNNVAIMKANWYYVHSLHVYQMVARFCFATTC